MKKLKKHITYSKIITFIFAVAIPFILTYGNKTLDLINKLKTDKKQLQETLNKRTVFYNETINYQYNEIGQLIQDTEICETTRKILQSKHSKRTKQDSEIINQYDYLLDSVHTRFAYKENNVNELTSSNNIASNKLTIKNSNIPNKKISSLKSSYLQPLDKSKPKLFKRIITKVIKKD